MDWRTCPACGKRLHVRFDLEYVAGWFGRKGPPLPGDLTVCTGCLRALCVTEYGGLRLALKRESAARAAALAQLHADFRRLWPETGGRWR